MDDWLKWSQLVANGATALGILGLALYYYTHRENQKQFKFNLMLNCIERYQDLLPLEVNGVYDPLKIRKYIDLTGEELFYFQQSYIPKVVIIEWLDSIVDNFPIYVDIVGLPINYTGSAKEIHDNGGLKKYPRILKALKIANHNIDMKTIEGKKELIKLVATNLGIQLTKRQFKNAVIS